MKILVFIVLFFFPYLSHAQITGKVTTKDGTPISYVNVSVENTFLSTIANENGLFDLDVPKKGKYQLVFQQLGYKTLIKKVTADKFPFEINVSMEEEASVLDEMLIETPKGKDKATWIIKKASEHRKKNDARIKKYTSDFYSKGSIQVIDYPKKFLGYNIEELDPNLKIDSLKNKFIYLSETFSKIAVEKPNHYKEEIKASKISGNDNGFSFNSGLSANFDFYQNIAYYSWKLVSPLAPIAPSYYNFKLMEAFTDDQTEQLIYKIEVKPKRTSEPVLDGYIYIVDGSWEIYAIDATVKGKQVEVPQIDDFFIRQTFSYIKDHNAWIKNSQIIDFNGKILVFKFKGNFNYIYNNLEEIPSFPAKTFSNEIITFQPGSNNRSKEFWQENRPIPLTNLEYRDYNENDKKLAESSTRAYQDSLDKVHNKFNLFKLVQGYKYRNSYNNRTYKYNGLLSTFAFNAVQGFNVTTGLSYLKENPTKKTFYEVGGLINYGIAENKPRFSGFYSQLFDRVYYSKLDITGGSTVHQFGEDYPIKKIINSISSSWFGKNYAKFYHKDFIRVQYEQEVYNGIFTKADIEYANRTPLFNQVKNSPFVKNKSFSSNNPVDPDNFTDAGFVENHIVKLKLNATISFDQKYIMYPYKKENYKNTKYPLLNLNYEKGFASSEKSYNYELLGASLKYNTSLGYIGNFGGFINGGFFINASNIAFMDYKHFYGNETFVGTTKDYLQNFNLLPYYSHSTNNTFLESHFEHNFKGFILNKVPLINKFQWNLVLGFHSLQTKSYSTYYEYSIGLENFGFGKFRPFRIDYVRSYESGVSRDGIVIGIKFLDGML